VCEVVDGIAQRSYPTRKLYFTLISVLLFFLPVSVMSVAYGVIICRLWLHRTPGESVNMRSISISNPSAFNAGDETAQVNVKKKVSFTMKLHQNDLDVIFKPSAGVFRISPFPIVTTFAKEDMFSSLFVRLSVSNFAQKLPNGFA